ncbi:MAG: PfkB family carbohydrate kinase [Solirubrobacteraceae bacterium]
MTRVAVVGHVEWVEFVRVPRFPERGAITHARDSFQRAAGGGAVAAVVLAELGADVDFFCALGRDANGEAAAAQLSQRGVRVHAAWREQPTRRVIALVAAGGERTIVTIGDRLEPLGGDQLDWGRLNGADGVYFTAGDAAAVTHARHARVLTSTPRAREALEQDEVMIDALVFSRSDTDEHSWAERVQARTRLMVETEGAAGGRWWGESEGRWPAAAPPGEPQDDYGCGDSFAAGFTFGLAGGEPVLEAARIGAECGARMLTVAGAP